MADLLQDIFKNRKASPEKLLLFGFEEKDGSYIYSRTLENSGLKLTVRIGKQGGIMSEVVDTSIHEPYTLHLVDSASGSFVGRVEGNRMKFTRDNDSNVYYIDKPTTQDMLEGRGAFDRGNGVEKAIEAQLCAAFNRGVATEPDKWYIVSEYYKKSPSNYYAGFFHEHSVCGLAYGFCYDDVNDQSTLLQYDKADALVIDLRW